MVPGNWAIAFSFCNTAGEITPLEINNAPDGLNPQGL